MDPIVNDNEMNEDMDNTQALLTAYALGELEGDDLAKAEALIASDPAAKAEVAEIRRVGKQLEEALAVEGAGATAGLKPEQVQAIHARAKQAPETQEAVVARLVRPWVWWTAGSAAAAMFAVVLVLPSLSEERQAERARISSSDVALVEPRGKEVSDPAAMSKEQIAARDLEVQNLLRRAQVLRKEQNYDRALQLVNHALSLDPNSYAAQAMKDIIEATLLPTELRTYPFDASQMGIADSAVGRSGGATGGEDKQRDDLAATAAAPTTTRMPVAGQKPEGHTDWRSTVGNNTNAATYPYMSREELAKNYGGNKQQESAAGATSGLFSDKAVGQPQPSSPQVLTESNVRTRQEAGNQSLAMVAENSARKASHKKDATGFEREQYNRPISDTGGFNPNFNTEAYDTITDNPFLRVGQNPLSTFSIDVDTASYANVRRMLTQGQLPPAGAVRIEEMVNYFPYSYSNAADDDRPFAVHVETGSAPWAHQHRLVKIGIKGKDIVAENKPTTNIVFLIDVSGSMMSQDKMPLLKEGMKLLVNQMDAKDHVAIAVYAGAAGMVLNSTSGSDKDTIMAAIDNLRAGGSTNGGAGIQLAYNLASKNFVKDGVNRVILASDGDFNVGTTSQDELVKLIEEKRKSGVFLSVLGFGQGNFKDSTMEKLANKGNGNYAYIDTIKEAQKVLVEQGAGTLYTIAKDVKIQVEFNPAKVQAYRLIGYENRLLAKEDFNDDTKDAGEIGSGHTVTALYEVVPVGVKAPGIPPVDALKYQTPAAPEEPSVKPAGEASNELLTVKLRYKQPDGDVSTKMDVPVIDAGKSWQDASQDYRFAAGVAQFGMMLRNSPYKGDSTYAQVLDLAQSGMDKDEKGYRGEFIQLVEKARALSTPAQLKSE